MHALFESTPDVHGGRQEALPWIGTRPGLPYFVDERGSAWAPIGANDAITWPELTPLFRRKDPGAVEAHLRRLKDSGVTCLRLMLEYSHGEHRDLERPAGTFVPNMVRFWDDLFAMLERTGLRVLLTPFDTFFMWTRWRRHPYNRRNGGPCASRREWLTCAGTREAIKRRLAFATDRWGHSGALFAWDLWNEIHPAHGGDDPAALGPFIDDLSSWLRAYEVERHGRAHPQTVSIFGPELIKHPSIAEPIFRHPSLDFASTHLYEFGTIDDPRDTVAPALTVGRLMRSALEEASDLRPVMDSEHGPIHRFKDHKHTLPEDFDDEYFRHMQWAHLASGGAGGGMRWPNRHPHVLTPGMRRAQGALARFLPLIDWTKFRRRNLSQEIECSAPDVHVLACGDELQAVVWMIASGPLTPAGRLAPEQERMVRLRVPGLSNGRYAVCPFHTTLGSELNSSFSEVFDGVLEVEVTLPTDIAVAIRPLV